MMIMIMIMMMVRLLIQTFDCDFDHIKCLCCVHVHMFDPKSFWNQQTTMYECMKQLKIEKIWSEWSV